MSDNVKLVVTLSKGQYEILKNIQCGSIGSRMIVNAVMNGIPLDTVKAEIKEKCDRIDDIARANIYQYAPHREIQDLLCEILESIDKAESEEKPNDRKRI